MVFNTFCSLLSIPSRLPSRRTCPPRPPHTPWQAPNITSPHHRLFLLFSRRRKSIKPPLNQLRTTLPTCWGGYRWWCMAVASVLPTTMLTRAASTMIRCRSSGSVGVGWNDLLDGHAPLGVAVVELDVEAPIIVHTADFAGVITLCYWFCFDI